MSVSACALVFVSCFSYHHGYTTVLFFLYELSCIPGKEGDWNESDVCVFVCTCTCMYVCSDEIRSLKMCPLLITVIPEM
jgi:hypothetical protein